MPRSTETLIKIAGFMNTGSLRLSFLNMTRGVSTSTFVFSAQSPEFQALTLLS
jgi:hypothetical protein